ncbi:MAG: Zn-dependent hydrolase, partial [Bacteroidales bacterium]|nr:Zn-dependent hydrolase [Bacteroidales bacterium]
MKKNIFAAACLASLMAASCAQEENPVDRLVENYALVTIPAPDLTGITDNGKEVLKLYRQAADEVDKIYWQQNYADGESFLGSIQNPTEKLYASINYGPWDRIDGKPFLNGFGDKPAGAGFYPQDMTQDEFDAFSDPLKNSPYTLVIREGN